MSPKAPVMNYQFGDWHLFEMRSGEVRTLPVIDIPKKWVTPFETQFLMETESYAFMPILHKETNHG